MRGLISEAPSGGPGVAAPMALRRAVPAVYQEDPLFAELCHAFDELISPLVSAVDCFAAYLDPRLAPDDFLPWLADLVGCAEPSQDPDAARALIADAVSAHGVRGTPGAIRSVAARTAGVPEDHVAVDDPGGTRWSTLALTAHDWPAGRAAVRVLIPHGRDPDDVASDVRAALQAEAGVHCPLEVEVVLPPDPAPTVSAAPEPAPPDTPGPVPAEPPTAPPAPEQPPGPRMYGGQP